MIEPTPIADVNFSNLIRCQPGLKHLTEAGLISPLNLSQTIGKITVALQWVYVDAEQVTITAIAYGYKGVPRLRYIARISDEQSNNYPDDGYYSSDIESGSDAFALLFKREVINPHMRTHRLHLELNLVTSKPGLYINQRTHVHQQDGTVKMVRRGPLVDIWSYSDRQRSMIHSGTIHFAIARFGKGADEPVDLWEIQKKLWRKVAGTFEFDIK